MTMMNWSTDSVASRDRFGFWREAVCDAFLDLAPESRKTNSFHGHITMERSHRIDIARIAASEQRVARTTSHDGGWCYLNMQVRGIGETVQSGTTVVTEPGDSVILRTDEPFTFRFDAEFAQTAVRLPEALTGVVERPIRLAAEAPDSQMIRSLIDFGLHRSWASPMAPEPVHDRGLIEWRDNALVGLVDAAVRRRAPAGRTDDGRRSAEQWAQSAIDVDIDLNLRDVRLAPRDTASRVGMSVRSLHKSFEGRPRTFASEVRFRRLERAHRMLSDGLNDGLRVSDIAADCGFSSAAHFHRLFRQAFGESPASLRSRSHSQSQPDDGNAIGWTRSG